MPEPEPSSDPAGAVCRQCGKPLLADAQFCSKCGARAPRKSSDGSILNRLQDALGNEYRVMGELGSGGFAVVYLVRDLRLDRFLAVKVMQPHLLQFPSAVERFQREARFASQLNHPNVLSVAFAGSNGGLVYYAMPRIQGHTLREHIERYGPLPIADALHAFDELARGMEHAHRRGVIHRDIKPANIMLDPNGHVLILDFGIARGIATGESSLTASGEIIGSPEYLSPEQASGAEVDERSDIYSLGVVVFEMLTGEPPFTGRSNEELFRHHVSTPAPDVRGLRPEVPEAFAAAVARCLAKNPADRWSSAEDAARAAGANTPQSPVATLEEIRRSPSAGSLAPLPADAASPPPRLRDLLSGSYRLEREVGHGATARVYLAHDLKHDRPIAIKVLNPEIGLSVRVERFKREIAIAARLRHPLIVPLFDSGRVESFIYYVMPYVDGPSLRARLAKERKIPLAESLEIARETAGALHYAHEQGVVHRDIKPENILLADGHPVLADFGIARAIKESDSGKLTATGFTVGTPWYMSPEQGSGESTVDGRADIYSLACVLYEMLSGTPPYGGVSPQEVLARHAQDPVPSVRERQFGIPEGVDAALQKALAKEPAGRFRTAGEFAEALTASAPGKAAKRRWFW